MFFSILQAYVNIVSLYSHYTDYAVARPLHLIVASVTGAGFGINAVKYAIPALLALAGSAPSHDRHPCAVLVLDVAGTILFHAIPASGLGYVPVALSAFLAGIGGLVWVIGISAYQQAAVPGPMLGRVVASYRWIGWSAFFAGSIIAGPLADHLGFIGAFVVFASLNIVMLVGFPFVIPKSQVLDEPLIA